MARPVTAAAVQEVPAADPATSSSAEAQPAPRVVAPGERAARARVHWFDTWEPVLDDALDALPGMSSCPPDVYRALATARADQPKVTALVTRADTPVALFALRRHSRHRWQPVTQWMIPAAIGPALPGELLPSLASLRREVVVGWWRLGPPPLHRSVRAIEVTPVHRVAVADAELHWREGKGKHWKNVKAARRRCADLAVGVDEPGAAEWVVRNWELRWNVGPDDPGLSDRLLAARELHRAGLLRTVTLSQDGRWLAGATCVVDGSTLTAGVLHREPVDRRLPTGVRLIDATFEVARSLGSTWMDLGGGQDYKRHWAPQDGHHYQFTVSRRPCTFYSMRAYDKSRLVLRELRARAASATTKGSPSSTVA